MQHPRLQPPYSQTLLKQLLVDRELDTTCEVLSRNQILDHPGNKSLLVHVDQWLELHRRRERRKRVKHFRTTG